MVIKKMKGGYGVFHCHGSKKGQLIHKFPTKAKALAMHRAIEANKNRRLSK